jgi:hypothetical protein
MKGYYAFWTYDLFPHILGGTITKMRDDGSVETEEYGKGRYFKPMKVLPGHIGKELNEKIRALAKERDRALKEFNADWDLKISKLAEILFT